MKQLILLVLLTGMVATSAFAQPLAIKGAAPQPLACTGTDADGPLHPIAGKPYDYSASFNPLGGETYWYATKSTTFVTAGARVATVIANDGTTLTADTDYAKAGGTSTKTNVTWATAGLKDVNATDKPLFMVVEYKDPTKCSNNMKVYQIIPKNAFTVDILNISSKDSTTEIPYGTTDTQCFADIVSAKFVAPKMEYNYGVNRLYYEVVAANFTGSFTPYFKLSGLQTGQSAKVEWTVNKNNTGWTMLGSLLAGGTTLSIDGTVVNTNVTNTTLGVSIYVKVTVYNGYYEGLTDETVKLAVEAKNANDEPDINNATCAAPATTYEDFAEQTLNKRPTVTPDPATGTFVPQLP